MDLISARCRPNTFSIASEISPTVALARAASMASASKLPLPSPAERVSAASASSTSFWLRSPFSRFSLSICSRRTVEFSTLRISIGASSTGLYLLTPITACRPASMRACVLAEASSMRSFGTPASMAFAMPPSASTSWMWPQAFCARSRVLRIEWLQQLRPEQPRGAHLGDFHEKIHADRPEERQPRREAVDVEAGGETRAQIFDAVGQRIGELEVLRRTSLLHVVAGD